jgi:ParB family chromosome partitioning protein
MIKKTKIEQQTETPGTGIITTQSKAGEQPLRIPISQIVDTGLNPRSEIETIEDLKASISTIGIISPLLVRRTTKGYELIAGHRRLAAARALKLKDVPINMIEVVDNELQEMMLTENLLREDLNPIDEAKCLKAILDTNKQLTQAKLGLRLGKGQPWIANRLRLLQVPDIIQKQVTEGKLTPRHALVAISLKDAPAFVSETLADIEIQEDTTVEDYEQMVNESIKEDTRIWEFIDNTWELDDVKLDRIINVPSNIPSHGIYEYIIKQMNSMCKECKDKTKIQNQMFCMKTECWTLKARDAGLIAIKKASKELEKEDNPSNAEKKKDDLQRKEQEKQERLNSEFETAIDTAIDRLIKSSIGINKLIDDLIPAIIQDRCEYESANDLIEPLKRMKVLPENFNLDDRCDDEEGAQDISEEIMKLGREKALRVLVGLRIHSGVRYVRNWQENAKELVERHPLIASYFPMKRNGKN